MRIQPVHRPSARRRIVSVPRLRRPAAGTVTTALLLAGALAVSACGAGSDDAVRAAADRITVDLAPASPSGTSPGAATGVAAAAQAYVDAVNARDLDALVTSFARDGEIVDVRRSIRGHDAIRAWADNEVIGGTLRVVSVVENRADGQRLLVHWAPSGSSGWRAHYDFTVRGERIVKADLQYA
ncbi:nuclear transport factor 2 family protein [Nonomuraea diastatica]|uniref:Nuclear transport factor 2 family protein n=1 Tax=Nonomuraea diastatica TaxID=1848329 RepID=A0A4V2YBE6_9ACTN|nr:nuclear transport factor 2 family protein [Nonomuraea diastatica]TDD07326.1 nuclear transport factor 2 family protein [Nonomuraea diastatica]